MTDEMGVSSEEPAEERVKLVTEAIGAVVDEYPPSPGSPTEILRSIRPLSPVVEDVEETEEAMNPETGSTALGSIDWDTEVGTADAALLAPDYQLAFVNPHRETYQ